MRPVLLREREHEPSDGTAEAPLSKRLKVGDTTEELNIQGSTSDSPATSLVAPAATSVAVVDKETILPPSHSLLGSAPPLQDENGAIIRLMEYDVGISEYIAKDVQKIGGIIKQRCAIDSARLERSLIL
jgi:tRNA pseudouridine13 synthase